jgi:SAM-dependent methyltransferase
MRRDRRGLRALSLLAAAIFLTAGCGEADDACDRPEPPLGRKVFPLAAAHVLDDPRRDEWQFPEEVVRELRIVPGERIADIGCGTGYFTLRLLRSAGPTGHVLAIDIQQGMLDILDSRLDAAERERIELRRSASEQPLRREDAIDLAFCANTLHEVDDPGPFLRSLFDGLAPNGRLALINWLPRRAEFGPPPEDRISPERVRELATAAGFEFDREVDFLLMQSFLVFRKPAR